MHVYQTAGRPFAADLIEAVEERPDRSPTSDASVSAHGESATTSTSAEGLRRGVSRIEAMSLYAGLPRASDVEHRRLIVRGEKGKRREERTMIGANAGRFLLLWSSSTSTTTVRDCLLPPFHPRNEPPSEERPHGRGMQRQNQYAAVPPPPGENVRANHP